MIENSESNPISHVLIGYSSGVKHSYWSTSNTSKVDRYEGEVPLQDVQEKLFNWEAIQRPIEVRLADGKRLPVAGRHAIMHSESNKVFKIATDSYVIHQYHEWLVSNVAKILDNDLRIGIAGILRSGGGAFVSVETPENVMSRNDIPIKSKYLAASSHDSKLATSYKMVGTILLCENMLVANLWKGKAPWNNRHTMHSLTRVESVRESIGIQLADNTEKMCNFVDNLAEITVTESQWQEIVERLVPIPDEALPRVKARLENKRFMFHEMWENDPRCTPWKGSGFGAFQVLNTHELHIAGPDSSRIDRNMRNIFSDTSQQNDERILTTIMSVTGSLIKN